MSSALTDLTLIASLLKPLINKNKQVEQILKILCKIGFDLIYSLITILLKSNSLYNRESYQIVIIFFVNEKNWNHFLKDNCFC